MTERVVFGILVGGAGSRMGGAAKGLLRAPQGGTVLDRLIALCHVVAPDSPIVLLGSHRAYADVPLATLADAPAGVGPLGGVRALLLEAARLDCRAVVLGCDLPYLSAALLSRLVYEHPVGEATARAVSVRIDGYWTPVFAHYASRDALVAVDAMLARGQHSMARLLDDLGATALSLTEPELDELRDWDTPEDMLRS
jgi:molybdopterin-guanine dinucleotide biosynthesis protein A